MVRAAVQGNLSSVQSAVAKVQDEGLRDQISSGVNDLVKESDRFGAERIARFMVNQGYEHFGRGGATVGALLTGAVGLRAAYQLIKTDATNPWTSLVTEMPKEIGETSNTLLKLLTVPAKAFEAIAEAAMIAQALNMVVQAIDERRDLGNALAARGDSGPVLPYNS